MAKKIFYEKIGRRYFPVAEYNHDLMDSFTEGCHLVIVKPGTTSKQYKIDPAFAPMIAAGNYAADAICSKMVEHSKLRPSKTPVTEEQKIAWQNLAKSFGDEIHTLVAPSIRECVDEGIKAMTAESEKMLQNPAVKKAYDHFMLVYKLTLEEDEK